MKYEEISVEKIKPNEYNPNVMTKRVFDILVKNIKEEGAMLQPILVTKDLMIIDGEHRWKASKEAGLEEIPVIISESSDEEAKLKTIAFNKIRGEYDVDLFTELLEDLSEDLEYNEISNYTSIFVSDIKSLLGDFEEQVENINYDETVKAVAEAESNSYLAQNRPFLGAKESENTKSPIVSIMSSAEDEKSFFGNKETDTLIDMKLKCTLKELSTINKSISKLRKKKAYEDLSNGGVLAKFLEENV